MSGKVYAVASGKGGVGKTTTVVNLGVTLRADDHSVALVDADLGMANLGTFLGVEHEPTLHDVLAGETSLDDALVEQVEGFAILPGARDLRQYAAADPRGLGAVLEDLSERYEYVLVDTGAGVGFEDVLPIELVDEVILVASPDRAALGDAGKTAEISELLGVQVRGAVLTMTNESDDVAAIANELGVELLAAVPEDRSVPESTAAGRPLEAAAPESDAAEGYRELAASLTGQDVEDYEPPEASEEPTEVDGDGSDAVEPDAESTPEADAAPTDESEEAEASTEPTEPTDPDESSDDEGDGDHDEAEPESAEGEAPVDGDDADEEEPPTESDRDGGAEDEVTTDVDDEESESTAGDDEPAADEPKSGGILSRLGGLFR